MPEEIFVRTNVTEVAFVSTVADGVITDVVFGFVILKVVIKPTPAPAVVGFKGKADDPP